MEKLTSPDQIDRRLIIIRMRGWVALLCLFVLIISIVLWSIFGQIPMTANGMGIFFEPKAISLIPSQVEGFVSTIGVGQGDEVKQGEVLMVLRSPQMEHAGKELQEKNLFFREGDRRDPADRTPKKWDRARALPSDLRAATEKTARDLI